MVLNRIEDRDDLSPGQADVLRHLDRFRSITKDDEPASGQHAMNVEQELNRTGGEHPRQRSTREPEREVGRAGRKHNCFGSEMVRTGWSAYR